MVRRSADVFIAMRLVWRRLGARVIVQITRYCNQVSGEPDCFFVLSGKAWDRPAHLIC